jgi:hypothetical protein
MTKYATGKSTVSWRLACGHDRKSPGIQIHTSPVYIPHLHWLAEGEKQIMPVELSELDQLQANYKTAVDDWVAVIREEEVLASAADHSVSEIDEWENAADKEDAARDKAKAAKQAYEDALREKFFHF